MGRLDGSVDQMFESFQSLVAAGGTHLSFFEDARRMERVVARNLDARSVPRPEPRGRETIAVRQQAAPQQRDLLAADLPPESSHVAPVDEKLQAATLQTAPA